MISYLGVILAVGNIVSACVSTGFAVCFVLCTLVCLISWPSDKRICS